MEAEGGRRRQKEAGGGRRRQKEADGGKRRQTEFRRLLPPSTSFFLSFCLFLFLVDTVRTHRTDTGRTSDGHRTDKPDGHRVGYGALGLRRAGLPEIDESVRHSHAFGLFLTFTTTTSFNFFTDWKNSWEW